MKNINTMGRPKLNQKKYITFQVDLEVWQKLKDNETKRGEMVSAFKRHANLLVSENRKKKMALQPLYDFIRRETAPCKLRRGFCAFLELFFIPKYSQPEQQLFIEYVRKNGIHEPITEKDGVFTYNI